jgi:DNA mismatch endonuclease (patch repair protein)
MTDVFSKSKRSEVMARIRSRGNKATELAFAKLLRAQGITGWRRHLAIKLQGDRGAKRKSGQVKPDFVFKDRRVAVFIDGCFWHGCPLHCTSPTSNRDFWGKKLKVNRTRDRLVTRLLRKQRWTVLRLWEHQLTRHRWVSAKVREYLLSDDGLPK